MSPEPSPQPTVRARSAVDEVADRYVDEIVALSPMLATHLGLPGRESELDDLSIDGYAARTDLARRTLTILEQTAGAVPLDAVDRVTVAAMRERLGLEVEIHEAGHDTMQLDVIASPLQEVRGVFDLMDTSTEDAWGVVAARLSAVPAALAQWTGTLRAAAADGRVTARRQVVDCIEQCAELVAGDGFFAEFAAGARVDEEPLPGPLQADLDRACRAASAAYAQLAEDLRTHLLDRAPEADAVGRERYELASRTFLGASVDLDETYAWGREELARITADLRATARRVRPGAGVEEAVATLDADPAYRLADTDALRAWMQEKADEAIESLARTHFDIPEPVRTIEGCIAPTHTGGMYYTPPSDDFSRPGRMWWSVPKDVTSFTTWQELSTVYHEGVPGHHLQVAQTIYRRDLLNRWRRLLCWVSGHGEGWALYAERLMDELGYLKDPGHRLGFLDLQSLRAARVVVDIGVHCGMPAPASVGGGSWDYQKAWDFLRAHNRMEDSMLRFELSRYLGWPGQAPSYKVGERLWKDLREECRRREGAGFDLAAFHRRALDVGSVGLDVLREALLAA